MSNFTQDHYINTSADATEKTDKTVTPASADKQVTQEFQISSPDNSNKSLLDILKEVEERAAEAAEAETDQKINELAEIDTELAAAEERLAQMPKKLQQTAKEAMADRKKQLEERKIKLLSNAGVKIALTHKIIEKIKNVENFGDLAELTQSAIDLNLLTAKTNAKGNISFHTVRFVDDKRPGVKKTLLLLREKIYENLDSLAKKARDAQKGKKQ